MKQPLTRQHHHWQCLKVSGTKIDTENTGEVEVSKKGKITGESMN